MSFLFIKNLIYVSAYHFIIDKSIFIYMLPFINTDKYSPQKRISVYSVPTHRMVIKVYISSVSASREVSRCPNDSYN